MICLRNYLIFEDEMNESDSKSVLLYDVDGEVIESISIPRRSLPSPSPDNSPAFGQNVNDWLTSVKKFLRPKPYEPRPDQSLEEFLIDVFFLIFFLNPNRQTDKQRKRKR